MMAFAVLSRYRENYPDIEKIDYYFLLRLLRLRSRPRRTFSVACRSPISFLTGNGSSLTSVGMANICFFAASSGCFLRSTTSISQRSFRYSSHMSRRFLTACFEDSVSPAMYSRITHISEIAIPRTMNISYLADCRLKLKDYFLR